MASSEDQTTADAVTELTGNQMVVVEGQDWGPAVTKTIIKLNALVSADSINSDLFSVVETKESFN